MRFENYLFDLDGTLTDPALGITNSILYALEKKGYPLPPREELFPFIGPPLVDSFRSYCNISAEEARMMVDIYREYFSTKGLFENTVYENIPIVLKSLIERGIRLYVATSKPEPFAKQILDHFDLSQYFTFIGGSTMEETRTKKEDVIQYVLDTNRLDPAKTLMVGDRIYDVEGAHQRGLFAVGVLYGYGDQEELSPADCIVSTPLELLEI